MIFCPNDGDQMAAAVVEDPGSGKKAKRRNQGFFETKEKRLCFSKFMAQYKINGKKGMIASTDRIEFS